jgi:hypothetical protein
VVAAVKVGAIYNGVNSAFGNYGAAGSRGNSLPSAYLNYIMFDRSYKLLDMGGYRCLFRQHDKASDDASASVGVPK